MSLRYANAGDAAQIAAIYRHYALTTAITFATEGPTEAEFAARIADRRYPFLVAEEGGNVAGFVYAGAFRQKEAYRWDVEMTIYLAPGCTGRGLGRRLMEKCLGLLSRQGYLTAYSCITLPGEASVGLHRRCGFEELGVFPRTGYKLGRWHDVVWMSRTLGAFDGAPREPRLLVTDGRDQIGEYS